jgi:predicted acetylornithine/succinylornithine family transaminase
MKVWDADGKEYLDFLAGIAVCNLGHCHPKVTAAIAAQAGKLLHVSNLYHIEPQALLAEWLTKRTFAEKVFFCNSGAEANEGAIKLARKYHHDRSDDKRQTVISATMSFHGRTLATLTATGQEKVKKGFSPLPAGFIHVAYDDIGALESVVDGTTAAVILEPVQGEGGVRIPSPGYLAKVRELCTAKGALLIFDEVQTGAGRTGTFLACEAEGVTPDIATMAKGLGGGVPIGALLATASIASHFVPGTHATTFGGNPLSTSAGLATMQALEEENLLANCRETGAYFLDTLSALAKKHPVVRGARGRGLLLGLELEPSLPAVAIVKELMAEGFLTGTAGESVLRFAPPLIVTKKEVDALAAALDKALSGKS